MKKAMLLIVALIGLVTLGAAADTYAAWDLNQDGVCDGQDLILMRGHIATYDTYVDADDNVVPASPNWNPAFDLNHDGVVDGQDYMIVKRHIGQLSRIP